MHNVILETQALHLLPVLMRLESQDRPQHYRNGRRHGADTSCQVDKSIWLLFVFQFFFLSETGVSNTARSTRRSILWSRSQPWWSTRVSFPMLFIEDLYICSYSLFRPDPDTVCGHHGVYTRHEAQLPAPARLGGGQSQGQDGYRDSGLWNTASPGE